MDAKLFEQLRQLKVKKPFAPFRILTTGGEIYQVDDRMQFAFTEKLVCYADPKTEWFIEVKANDVAGLEMIDEKKPAA